MEQSNNKMYMNKFFLSLLLFAGILAASSCIKDEPKNMEADITEVMLDSVPQLDPQISNSTVFIYVNPKHYDIKNFKFNFTTTPGAVATPLSGTAQDFTNSVDYTITSEDGQFSKVYTVTVIQTNDSPIPNEFNFENFTIDARNKYTSFVDIVDGTSFPNWSSGNAGFALTLGSNKTTEAYPTLATIEKRSGEYAALMETKLTGSLGASFGSPIAAGNLYIGTFNTLSAMLDPLKATRFGIPFNKVPVELSGYYKYTPGPQVTDAKLQPLNIADSCDIYAVLYNRKELEATSKVKYLHGGNILSDPSIVAIARLANGSQTPGTDFVKFNAPFVFLKPQNQKQIQNMDYNLTIVLSSSKRGAEFIGAAGSKLIVDDLKLKTK